MPKDVILTKTRYQQLKLPSTSKRVYNLLSRIITRVNLPAFSLVIIREGADYKNKIRNE